MKPYLNERFQKFSHEKAINDQCDIVADEHGGNILFRLAVENVKDAAGEIVLLLLHLVNHLAGRDESHLHT